MIYSQPLDYAKKNYEVKGALKPYIYSSKPTIMPKEIESITLIKPFAFFPKGTVLDKNPTSHSPYFTTTVVATDMSPRGGLYLTPEQALEHPDTFKINYKEEPKKIKYWPNGALIGVPGGATELWSYCDPEFSGPKQIRSVKVCCKQDIYRLLKKKILFDTKEKAERAMQIAQDQEAIKNRIEEINLENDWVADWEDEEQRKFWFILDVFGELDFDFGYVRKTEGTTYCCEEAIVWLSETTEFTEKQKLHFIRGY